MHGLREEIFLLGSLVGFHVSVYEFPSQGCFSWLDVDDGVWGCVHACMRQTGIYLGDDKLSQLEYIISKFTKKVSKKDGWLV